MAKYKSLLKSTIIKPAGKKRKCYHNKRHTILKGELVLEVHEGMTNHSGYCGQCASTMLKEARDKISELEAEIA